MNHVTNTKLIQRNAKIGNYTNIGALVILAGGLVLSFTNPDKYVFTMGALILGFLLSQVGMYFGSRWSRKPRADEIIDKSLKGLGREYTVYHYVTPVSHVLLAPSGLWTITPYFAGGRITYAKKRWHVKGGGFVSGYLRLFGQDNIGRPDLESEADQDSLKRFLMKRLPEGSQLPPIRSLLVFANPTAVLEVGDAPLPALTPKEMKDFFRKQSKDEQAESIYIDKVREVLPRAESDDE
jgi:hypothetical protein